MRCGVPVVTPGGWRVLDGARRPLPDGTTGRGAGGGPALGHGRQGYDRFLHTHVWPRYEWERADIVGKAVWLYPAERWRDPVTALGSDHDELRADLTSEVDRLRDSVEFRFNV